MPRFARLTLLAGLVIVSSSGARADTLVWGDEFDTPTLDASTWTFDVGGGGFGNAELEYYSARPENARIQNGALLITAIRENYGGKQFTSARLKTHGRLAFKYGRLEARIQIPNLQNGLWPAFWLLGNNIGQTPWPASGEVDILEMGNHDAIVANQVNRRLFAAAHWDFQGSHALYGSNATFPFGLNTAYHVYSLDWTPSALTVKMDSSQIWTMDITGIQSNSLEEFHRPMFLLLNLAVGGINFVQITDPAQITAPMPAVYSIDYVRLYDNGYTELYRGEDIAESQNFGVYTDTTPVNDELHYDVDSDLFAWHNVTIGAASPYEGSGAWQLAVGANDWWGLGAFCRADRNMVKYSDGALHLHLKTTATATIGIGLSSSSAGDSWLDLINGGEQFGLVRDGAWHEVVIPLNRFGNVDFRTIKQAFMMRGASSPAALSIGVDNVYWSPSPTLPAPANGSFGIFTDDPAHKTAGNATLGADDDFYIWENTLTAIAGSPYEGSSSLAFKTPPGGTWFGCAFTPRVKYNLSGYRAANAKLHLALKSTATQTFNIGMKSGNVDLIGQKWIKFQNGSDPYGFVRDGQWHVLEIPMTDFGGVDLLQVSQLFELFGENPLDNIEFDDVCLVAGGAPLTPGIAGDFNGDGLVDSIDFRRFAFCLGGPGVARPVSVSAADFSLADADADGDVDLSDAAVFQAAYDADP